MLPTWSERAVFGLIVSRDSLCRRIAEDGELGDDEDDPYSADEYGRREYSERILSKDSGLSDRAIRTAKQKLVDAGLIEIDPAYVGWRNRGRIRMIADTLYLNPQFKVPETLIFDEYSTSTRVSHRPEKMAVQTGNLRRR